ncbi:MAG TPA: hypothetical protein VHW70_10610, partial [Edaphobacter sp.]|nr:hypothetical protein [Edaphobacter sp.]
NIAPYPPACPTRIRKSRREIPIQTPSSISSQDEAVVHKAPLKKLPPAPADAGKTAPEIVGKIWQCEDLIFPLYRKIPLFLRLCLLLFAFTLHPFRHA